MRPARAALCKHRQQERLADAQLASCSGSGASRRSPAAAVRCCRQVESVAACTLGTAVSPAGVGTAGGRREAAALRYADRGSAGAAAQWRSGAAHTRGVAAEQRTRTTGSRKGSRCTTGAKSRTGCSGVKPSGGVERERKLRRGPYGRDSRSISNGARPAPVTGADATS